MPGRWYHATERQKGKAKAKAHAQPPGKLPRYVDSISALVKDMQEGAVASKKLDPEDEEKVKKVMTHLAGNPKDLKAAFSKLGRRMEPETLARKPVPPEVLQRYSTDKKDERRKFIFVAEFMADPSFGKLILKESHYRMAEKITAEDKGWKPSLRWRTITRSAWRRLQCWFKVRNQSQTQMPQLTWR